MNRFFTACLFLSGGASLMRAAECWIQHQWAGWMWLICALIATVAGSWRLEDRSTYFDG